MRLILKILVLALFTVILFELASCVPCSNKNQNTMETSTTTTKSKRGFASVDPAIMQAAARKGGIAVSRDRNHMAEIGRMGGIASGKIRRAKNGGSN